MTTNYSRYTKAQLIELLEKKDEKYNNLLKRAKEIIKDKNDEIKTLKDEINDYQQTIQDLKDKYESDDFEKFVELYGMLADRMTTNNIQKEYFKETGNKLTLEKTAERLQDMGYEITKINKCGIHCYATKRTEGYHYLIQLEKEVGESIYKVGIAYDMLSRCNTYFKNDQTNIIVHKCFKVDVMNKSEKDLLGVLNSLNIPIAHGEEYFITDYETISKHYLDAVARHAGVEVSVDSLIARQKGSKKHNFKIVKGQ